MAALIPDSDIGKCTQVKQVGDTGSERKNIVRIWTQWGKRSLLGQEERNQWRNTIPQLSWTMWPRPITPSIGRGSNFLCLNPIGRSEESRKQCRSARWGPTRWTGTGVATSYRMFILAYWPLYHLVEQDSSDHDYSLVVEIYMHKKINLPCPYTEWTILVLVFTKGQMNLFRKQAIPSPLLICNCNGCT